MKKYLIVIVYFFLINKIDAQSYQWQSLPQSITCSDSTLGGQCYVSNLLNDTVHHLLWIAGQFDGISGISYANVAAWDGSKFVPNNLAHKPFTVTDMIMYDSTLVVCRNNSVVQYNVLSGQGVVLGNASGDVYCLGIYNGDLIAGGNFYSIKGVAVNSIARWDGSKWHDMGGGITGSTSLVWALQEYKGELYSGGTFDKAGNINAWNIARWNGASWNQVGGLGSNNNSGNHSAAFVKTLAIFKNNLYAAGDYDSICGIFTKLAFWNGSNWSGTNFTYPDIRHANSNDSLLFLMTPYVPTILSWDGNKTAIVDSGFNSTTRVEMFNDTLYAGGFFDSSGHTPMFRLARLVWDTTKIYDNVTVLKYGSLQMKVYPNPGNNIFTIELNSSVKENQEAELTVANLLGQTIQYYKYNLAKGGKIKKNVTISEPGQYIVSVKLGSEYYHSTFVSLKD